MKKDTIKLELLTKSDKTEYFRLIEKNRNNLREFMDWVDATQTENDLDDFLERGDKMYADKTGCNFKIIANNEFIGTIGFFRNSDSKTLYEIGYWLDKDKRNLGIITSIVPAVEQICINKYRAEKLEIWCAVTNIASNKVAQKNAYELEKSIPKHKSVSGVVLDYNVYSKLKTAGN
jgi:ribosomal-protein-serine acetyltransferase